MSLTNRDGSTSANYSINLSDGIYDYNVLLNITNQIHKEREFWRQEDARKGSQIMLCWNNNINVPDKPLLTKEVCKDGCYYKLYCSDSMKPFFDCSDTLIVYQNIEQDEIKLCDIIGFKSPEHLGYNWTIHRIIEINSDGYRTKGDANTNPDNYTVKFDDIIFKVIGVEYG